MKIQYFVLARGALYAAIALCIHIMYIYYTIHITIWTLIVRYTYTTLLYTFVL